METRDGVCLWRGDLSRFVRKHGVRLPGQFVTHVLETRHLPRFLRDRMLCWSQVEFLHDEGWWRTSHGWTVTGQGSVE